MERLVPEPQVDEVDLDLAPPMEEEPPARPLRPSGQAVTEPRPRRHPLPGRFQRGDRRNDIGAQLVGRAPRAGLDVAVPLLVPPGVLLDGAPGDGGVQHADMGLGVAGEMGQDVPDRPAGQQARTADDLVVDGGGRRLETSMSGGAAGDRGGELLVHVPTLAELAYRDRLICRLVPRACGGGGQRPTGPCGAAPAGGTLGA